MTPYDSTHDTLAHIERVRQLLALASAELTRRGEVHDASKLVAPEKGAYDELVPKLREAHVGQLDYMRLVSDMETVKRHHAKHNSHHALFYPGGVNDFDLFDLVEMFFDLVAEHPDGGVIGKIEAENRAGVLSDQVARIMYNTSQRYVGMLTEGKDG